MQENASKLPSVVVVLLALTLARVVLISVGWDQLNTISWRTVTSIVIALAVGTAILLWVVSLLAADVLAREGADRVKTRFAPALLIAGIFAAPSYWLVGSLMGVLAQHLDGPRTELQGTIRSLRKVDGARTRCVEKAIVDIYTRSDPAHICLKTKHARSIVEGTLHGSSQSVRVTLKHNAFGVIAVSVAPYYE